MSSTYRRILIEAMSSVINVPGAFVEFGVFRGATLVYIAQFARSCKRVIRGFDSFMGMAEPTEKDAQYYPKGSLNAGGMRGCIENLQGAGVKPDEYKLIEGFIPESLKKADFDAIAFAHVDLDQYVPTKTVLEWIWSRLSVGGVILCHDYFKGRQRLAALAIDEFIAQKQGQCLTKEEDYTLRITRS
jgi:O-methyltransferase